MCLEEDHELETRQKEVTEKHDKYYNFLNADEDRLVQKMEFSIQSMMAEVILRRMRAKPGEEDMLPTSYDPEKVKHFINQS